MNGTVKEWVDKAEGDFDIAQLAMNVRSRPNCDAVCFHAQQCIEKLMKGLLIHRGVQPPRTHNLNALAELVRQVCPNWICPDRELRFLSKGAGALRYPGASAERDDAVLALTICERVRKELLNLIGDANA